MGVEVVLIALEKTVPGQRRAIRIGMEPDDP